jgi:hypothetical protein
VVWCAAEVSCLKISLSAIVAYEEGVRLNSNNSALYLPSETIYTKNYWQSKRFIGFKVFEMQKLVGMFWIIKTI